MMLQHLLWFSHFVLEAIAVINTISQMTALGLALKEWSIPRFVGGHVMFSQEKGPDGL